MLGTRTVQDSNLDYDPRGAMIGMNLEGVASPFVWDYQENSGLLQHLTYPNGMVRSNTYHPKLNLVTSIGYRDPEHGETISRYDYQYDQLIRPIQRRDLEGTGASVATRNFSYNNRSELTEDQTNQERNFSCQYDNIGNRKTARAQAQDTSYDVNWLNQYTDITQEDVVFMPAYDADGNQTRVKTSTGIWNISYDANNRPVSFTKEDKSMAIICDYDCMGRRFSKKVIVHGATAEHVHYLYRGYLQLAEVDLMRPEPTLKKSYLWDPTELAATRILLMTVWKEKGTEAHDHLYLTHDGLKNVTFIVDEQKKKKAHYAYASFGKPVTAEGSAAGQNKFRFSSEYMDDELGLSIIIIATLIPQTGDGPAEIQEKNMPDSI